LTNYLKGDIFISTNENERKTSLEELEKQDFTEYRIKVLKTLGNIIKNLQEELPKITVKDRELPLFYIDPNIILNYLTNKNEQKETQGREEKEREEGQEKEQGQIDIPDRVVNESTIAIDYLEDVPTANGMPFWERIDCEPIAYYKLFKIYRNQKEEKLEGKDSLRTHRSFENLKDRTGIPEVAIHALNNVYHWQSRVKAYDLFRENVVELERQKIIKTMETSHRSAAQKIFEQCTTYLTDISEHGWYDLKGNLIVTPKDMIGWFESAVKLERLSLGLPTDKPLNDEEKSKITKVITNVKFQQDNKVLNINPGQPKGMEIGSIKYLQEMIDILSSAGALPKEIEASRDVQESLITIDEKEVKDGENKI
jgi:hypothetical protein